MQIPVADASVNTGHANLPVNDQIRMSLHRSSVQKLVITDWTTSRAFLAGDGIRILFR